MAQVDILRLLVNLRSVASVGACPHLTSFIVVLDNHVSKYI